MNAVLVRQNFVDRLLLKSCGDEKLTRLEIISGTMTA